MDNCVFIFKYAQDKYMAPTSSFDSFASLVLYVSNKWKHLDESSIVYHYSIGEHLNCKIDSQVDYSGLIWIIKRDEATQVDILVSGEIKGFVRDQTGPGRINSTEEGHLTDALQSEPAFFVHREKILLSRDWPDCLGDVGKCITGGFPELRNSICKYQCETGFRTKPTHNNHSKYGACCLYRKTTGCRWWIFASISSKDGLLYIKTFYNVHSCMTPERKMVNSSMTLGLVKDLIIDDARSRLDMKPKEIIHRIRESYGFTIEYKRAYDALNSAKMDISGDPGRSYQGIEEYFQKLKLADPTGSVLLETDPIHGTFERAHFAFGASLDAFRSCRPMLFMDGTFLKNKYKGTLLTAVAKDGNNALVPVAFAIVRGEDNENWAAFMKFLRPLVTGRQLVIISDRHPGLLNGVRNIFPEAYHSYCFRHIKGNLISKLTGNDRRAALLSFEHLTKAPNDELFEFHLGEFLRLGCENAVSFLESLPFKHFTNVHFPGSRYGELTSNAAESFNNQILKLRELPVAQFIDKIRLMMMKNIYNKSVLCDTWTTVLVPRRQIEYNEKYQVSRTWEVSRSSPSVFEVRCDPTMIVDIDSRSCSCGKWKIEGFPCEHAVRALAYAKPDTKYDYVETFFHVDRVRAIYASKIPALTTFCLQTEPTEDAYILPPKCKIPPGRPQSKRKLSQLELLRPKIRCGRCHLMGFHNKKTCTANL